MAYLHLDLLGGFAAHLQDGRPCVLPTRKVQALLAFLAVPAGRFHSRDKLTALLWGDTPEAQARQSFRQALAGLRRALGPGATALMTRGDTVALDAAAVSVDVAGLEQDVTLYKGDLLDGLRVDEPRFEEWLVGERERLHALALELLGKQLRRQLDREPDAAIQTALRLIAIDPLQEEVHRTLMRLLLKQGRRAAALQQYQACVGQLERELDAEPEEATRQLYREILRASAPTRAPAAPVAAVGTRAGDAPLIGRGDEAAQLSAALAGMLDHGGGLVLVRGEAGIGKSRLLRELAGEAGGRGLTVALGQCHETEQILPLQPWIDALRRGQPALDPGLRDKLGANAVAHLGRVFPELLQSGDPPGSTGEQYALLFDALARLIAELTAERPMLLLLEDLHWADGLSARFLAFLGRRLDRLPLLVVASTRPEELVDAPVAAQALKELRIEDRVTELALRPLSAPDSQALVKALQPSGATGAGWTRLRNDIWAISEGNPFVIAESVRALRDGAGEAGLAKGVRDFVAGRLDRLGEEPRQAVSVAAAIGRDFAFPLFARAASIDEARAAEVVEELVRRRILDSVGDRLAFCHDWIRRVAYDALLPQRRAVLHANVGAGLEAVYRDRLDEVADQLGHHYSRAGDAGKAVPHLIRFSDLAAQRYALDDAVRALDQAIAVVASLAPAERDRRALDLVLRKAFVLSILGRQREIAALLDAHAEQVKHVADPALVAEYHFRVGLTCFYLGERERARRAADLALAEAERAGDGIQIGKALHVLSLNAFEAGRPREGIAHARRAIPLLDLPHMQAWLGLAYHDLALNCLVAGDLVGALQAAQREDAIGVASEWPRVRALAGYVMVWIHALRGDTDEAVAIAERSLAVSRDPMVASLVTGTLGFARLEQGDPSAVAILTETVERLRKSPVRSGELRHMALLAEAQLVTGDRAQARVTATRALELSASEGTAYSVGLAHRALGRIALAEGALAEAERQLAQAVATFESCEAAFEVGRVRLLQAELCQRQRRDAKARAHLAAAMEAFAQAEAPTRLAQARALGIAAVDA